MNPKVAISAIILLLLLIIVIKNVKWRSLQSNLKKIPGKLISFETVLLFVLSFVSLYFFQQYTGKGSVAVVKGIFLASVTSMIWVLFYSLLKEYRYNLLAWAVFGIYSLCIYGSFVSFGPVSKMQILLYAFWFIQLGALYVIIFNFFSRRVPYVSSMLTGLFSCFIAALPLAFIFYRYKFGHPLRAAQLSTIWQTNSKESLNYLAGFFPLLGIIALIILFILIFLLMAYQERMKPKPLTSGIFFSVLILAFVLVNFNMYAALSLPKYMIKAKHFYGEDPAAFKNEQHQRLNISEIASIGQSSRVIPHRVNSIGKLKRVINEGNTGFEMDMVFDHDTFQVGHDETSLSGLNVSNYLEVAKTNHINKMWFDTKNLDEKNYAIFKKELDKLDRLYNLKSRIILESKTQSALFSNFSEDGYHTSYYLPAKLKFQPEHLLQKNAELLAAQLKKQQVRAISFDIYFYPFVKKYLEKLISPEICYHTWDMSKSFNKPGLKDSLMKEAYFHDERIKTILVPLNTGSDL